ncbi:efflux RND transporter permease subunit [Marinisporobacter balticus]|uniref:Multidrug efflux pump subunit AcrB n=1 Tax=Marinisporobacter balticus TaxID=2018667 RepID=A0A4R2KP93_9FIRM|nr:efflux RND transporter permease subunit [Marinisporobacter balticus]TCO72659.1 multidrug efflux pump subunit AcrB [Marinisporobacter balticus]
MSNKNEINDEINILGRMSNFFVERYRVVYLILIGLLLLGGTAYIGLPRERSPEIELPYVNIMTTYVGASPNEIENLITDEIESKINGLEDIKEITSTSQNGVSSITIEYEIGTDVDKKIQDINNEISKMKSKLPEDSDDPIVRKYDIGKSPIMQLNISGDYDLVTLKNIAEDIKDEIEKIDGIQEVDLTGGLDREIHIYIDEGKLKTYNLTTGDIKNSISSSNVDFPGGDIDLDDTNYNIRTIGSFKEIEEIENTVIMTKDNVALKLKDVAEVKDAFEDVASYAQMFERGMSEQNKTTNTIKLSVTREDDGDIIGPCNEILALIEGEKGILYPSDVFISVANNQAVDVQDSLNDVVSNAISGLLVVIIVLFLFIGLRESIIVSFVIPLSLLCSFILMKNTDMTFNGVSVLALILALGMLVDNAIVIMENIDRIRDEGYDVMTASKVATNQVAPAVMASTLTTMAAFFPMALMGGIMGQFMKVIPIVVMFAIGSSFVISLVITPVLCSKFLSKYKKDGKKVSPKIKKLNDIFSVVFVFILSIYAFSIDGKIAIITVVLAMLFAGAIFIKKFKMKENTSHEDMGIIKIYSSFMGSVLSSKKKRILVLVCAFALFVTSLATIPMGLLKIKLLPDTDSTTFTINIETPPGYLLSETAHVVEEVESLLYKYEEVDNFVSSLGSDSNKASVDVNLVETDERKRSSNEIAAMVRSEMANIPGAKITIGKQRHGPSNGKPISIELRGDDLNRIKEVANDFKKIIDNINGTTEVFTSLEGGRPELQIKINKEKAATLGLSVTDVSMQIRNTIQGIKVSELKQNNEETDIIIKKYKDEFKTLRDLEKIDITSNKGEKVPFKTVASIKEDIGLSEIEHDDLDRIVKIEGEVEGVTSRDVIQEFKNEIKDYPLPKGVNIAYGGETQDTEESFTELFIDMIIAVLLVFIILAVQFNSLSQPIVILVSVPLAMIGVMGGLILTNNNFGMYGFMGLVALVGIAVNDAIVLVDYTNYLRKSGRNLLDAVREAGKTRFMPVFATSITTIGGILPLAIKNAEYGEMGYALIFGLVASTVLTLVIIPIGYSLLEETKVYWSNKKKGRVENEEA